MRLPKPIYEIVPYILVGVGSLFIYLVLRRYEYAPTLFIWLLGIFCILAGVAMIVTRLLYRHSAKVDAAEDAGEDED
jgi:uncharacterized membrane protein HdeD (DUF308 family)